MQVDWSGALSGKNIFYASSWLVTTNNAKFFEV